MEKIIRTVLLYSVLVLIGFLFVLPVLWMLSTSFKSLNEVLAYPIQWLPNRFQWENYVNGFERANFILLFSNSFFIAGTVTLIRVVFCSLAGFSLAKYEYTGKGVFFAFILSTMMIPFEVIVVPLFLIVKELDWLNSYAGLIVPVCIDAFGVFLMRQYIKSIPDEMIEAARIDGTGEFGIFVRMIIPLSRPAITALAIFAFMDNWDSFLWPLVVVSDEAHRTLTLGLAAFENSYVTAYHELMAVSVIAMAPIVLMYGILQKNFIEGMVLSGSKEG